MEVLDSNEKIYKKANVKNLRNWLDTNNMNYMEDEKKFDIFQAGKIITVDLNQISIFGHGKIGRKIDFNTAIIQYFSMERFEISVN